MGCVISIPEDEQLRMERTLDKAAPNADPPVRPNPGTMTDLYDVSEILGQGSFATVHLATRRSDGVQVAMKSVHLPELRSRSASKYDGVFHEIGVLSELDCEYIIRMDEFFADIHVHGGGRQVHIATELLSGGEVLEHLKTLGHYDEMMARRIFARTLAGVQYMHSVGVTHRDMKPANLLLGDARDLDTVKICDLGLAKKATEVIKDVVLGTPWYIAPEIVEGRGRAHAYGPAVDNWACGVILYVLLSGRHPFDAPEGPDWQLKLWAAILRGEYNVQSPAWRLVSAEAKDLLSKLLTVDEEKRMTAAEALQHPWITADDDYYGVEGEHATPDGATRAATAAAEKVEEEPARSDGGGGGGGGGSGTLIRADSGVHLSESMNDLRQMDFEKAAAVVIVSNRLANGGGGSGSLQSWGSGLS